MIAFLLGAALVAIIWRATSRANEGRVQDETLLLLRQLKEVVMTGMEAVTKSEAALEAKVDQVIDVLQAQNQTLMSMKEQLDAARTAPADQEAKLQALSDRMDAEATKVQAALDALQPATVATPVAEEETVAPAVETAPTQQGETINVPPDDTPTASGDPTEPEAPAVE